MSMHRFGQSIANAIADIREKVVEEPWFGRNLTSPRDLQSPWGIEPPKAEETSLAHRFGWSREAQQPPVEHTPEHSHEYDR